jgi:hypothetical protein
VKPIYKYMDQLTINQKAIEEVEMSFENKKIWDIYKNDPNGTINYLRLLGIKCSKCSKDITGPNFEFFRFSKKVQCYDCQNLIKK